MMTNSVFITHVYLGVSSSMLPGNGKQCSDTGAKVNDGEKSRVACEKSASLPGFPYYSYDNAQKCSSTFACKDNVRLPFGLSEGESAAIFRINRFVHSIHCCAVSF